MFFVFWFGLFTFSEGIQVTPAPDSHGWVGYHDYNQMTEFLRELASNYSSIAGVHTIGKSAEGRDLWVLKIRSQNTPIIGAPNVKFIGNIHGNEPVGRELILLFAEYLLRNYQPGNEVAWILDRTVIHLLPSLNPDGFEKSKEGVCYSGPGRENGNSVDLNRSFPDPFEENKIPIQPEALAVAHWMSQVNFVLSASFHGGALVANYPFDSNPGNARISTIIETPPSEFIHTLGKEFNRKLPPGPTTATPPNAITKVFVYGIQEGDFAESWISDSQALWKELMANITKGDNLMDIWRNLTPNERDLLTPRSSLTPDDDVFKHLAQTYSNNHLTMHKGRTCNENQPSFPGGITNGAAWYSFTGGMQDFNYVERGCMELTLEISCCKYPQASHLPRLWEENRKAMLELIKQSQMGVTGIVVDKETSAYVPGAVLRISGRSIPFTTSKNGEFWRILLPGNYILIVEANGYITQRFPFTVAPSNSTHPQLTWLNIYLQPLDEVLESTSSNMAKMVENSGSLHPLPLPVSFCLPIFFSLFTRRGLS